jgi:hypothetical protein
MDFETIFNDFLTLLNSVVFNILSKLGEVLVIAGNYINENALKPAKDSLGVWAVMNFSKIKIFFSTRKKELEKKYPAIQLINEYSWYFICLIHSILINTRLEPKENHWISIAPLYKLSGNQELNDNYLLEEHVNLLPCVDYISTDLKNEDLLLHMNEWIDATQNLFEDQGIKEILILLKFGKQYVYRICRKGMSHLQYLLFESSGMRFLSIEYSYPGINKPIFIDVDKYAYFVDNEILSPAFIKRFFDHNIGIDKDVFRSEYVLKIMDNNLNNFEITNQQYILLQTNSYAIKDL